MRFTSLLSAALLAVGLSRAQSPDGGSHSTSFDKQKYTLPDMLLITPSSHANLFSFTGRWLRSPTAHPHAPTIHATLWPGNSVTVLVYGDRASVKLRPKPQGKAVHYSFAVSIDGAPDVRYNTGPFDTSAPGPEGHYIPFKFPKKELHHQQQQQQQQPVASHAKLLEPHTIRITSISSTPFSFEGLLVPNTHISQGHSWEEAQALRPVVEFVGEGLDAERPGGFFRTDSYKPPAGESVEQPAEALYSTVHYRLAEFLGLRHTHMAAGTCLLPRCDKHQLPGFEAQYFFTSPVDSQGRSPSVREPTDPRHLENLQAPFRFSSGAVPTCPPTHVIVDTGILDVVIRGLSPQAYAHALARFLVRMRNQAHPDATILVVAHRGASASVLPPAEHSAASSPSSASTATSPSAIAARRSALFAATRDAVALVDDSNTHFTPVHLDGGDPQPAYLLAVCPYMVPGVVARTKGFFRRQAPSRTQLLCADVLRRRGGYGGVLFFALALLVAGLWVARSTVLGALAAVVGRRRLGMSEEDGGLLERERPANGK